jgi:predicted nucleotidyltransferase
MTELSGTPAVCNQAALQELKTLLVAKYPEQVEQLILFGSQSNGTARDSSDYDLLVILRAPYDWRFENGIYDTCSEINVKYDIITDVKIISRQELHTLRGKLPYIQHALHNGIRL